jgi:excisionase family DNA binding protein
MPVSKFTLQRNCENCGKQFNAKTVYSKYCCEKCSEAATRKRKALAKEEEKRKELAKQIPVDRPYISIQEAVILFGISRDTIYRQIKKGNIPAVNLGERLTRISRVHIEAMFPTVEVAKTTQPIVSTKEINFDPANCYTIGEITEKFGISASTVQKTIRKCSIPKKQIGKFVYVPKAEIDRLFANK